MNLYHFTFSANYIGGSIVVIAADEGWARAHAMAWLKKHRTDLFPSAEEHGLTLDEEADVKNGAVILTADGDY